MVGGGVGISNRKIHEFLRVTYDFSTSGVLKLKMDDYVEQMVREFSVDIKEKDAVLTLTTNKLLEKGNSSKLEKESVEDDGFEDNNLEDIGKENVSFKLSSNNSSNQSHMGIKWNENYIPQVKGIDGIQNV